MKKGLPTSITTWCFIIKLFKRKLFFSLYNFRFLQSALIGNHHSQPPEGSEEEEEDGSAGRGFGEWESKVSGDNQEKEDGPKVTIGMAAALSLYNCAKLLWDHNTSEQEEGLLLKP